MASGATSQQKSNSQTRGASPKIPPAASGSNNLKTSGQSQLNMSGQNLQNYFENQIPQFQGVSSSKTLPRKKRISVQPGGSALGATSSQANSRSGEQSESGQPRNLSRGKTVPGAGGLPPMGNNASSQ